MKNFISHIHYAKYLELEEKLVYIALGLIKPFYFLGVKARLLAYRLNWLKQTKVNARVISIGNLTTGGTGKTPVCVAIANYFTENLNVKTAILSRGYGGKLANSQVNTISDGENIFFSAHMSGDEPYWLAYNAQKTVVLTCKNRIEAAKTALEKYGAQLLILDDGFQYIKLHRDLNIMLIDGNLKFGNGKLLPQGPLREPLSEIKRADVILVMNKRALDKEANKNCEEFAKTISEKYDKKTIVCNFAPQGIFSLDENKTELFAPQKVYAFAGIGQPKFFFEYLENQGFDVLKKRVFEDHHLYTSEDIKNILSEAKKLGANAIVTTEKDAVKIKALLEPDEIAFYALKLGLDLDVNEIF